MTSYTPLLTLRSAKNFVPATAAVAFLLMACPSWAQVTAISETSLNALNPTAVTPIPGDETDPPVNTITVTVGTQTLTFTNPGTAPGGTRLERRDQAPTGLFVGDFPDGTQLIDNIPGNNAPGSLNGLNIAFSSPVSAFGFNLDPDSTPGFTDYTLIVTEVGGAQTFFTQTNVANNQGNTNILPFFGVQDAGPNLISSVRLFGVAAVNPPGGLGANPLPNDFAVGLLRFIAPQGPPPSVPEPGSLALLLGMAATGTGCFARRKRLTARK